MKKLSPNVAALNAATAEMLADALEKVRRFYVFNPSTGLWMNWQGRWTTFQGAKDFPTAFEAYNFSKENYYIMELVST